MMPWAGRVFLACVLTFASAAPALAVFDLSASPRKGGRDLQFRTGIGAPGVREEELILTVSTDQAAPYRIYWTLLSPLANEQGQTLSPGVLSAFSPTQGLGSIHAKLETPLSLGQTPLYESNTAGDADQLTLVFHLNLPPDVPGGTYRSRITFTLETTSPAAGLTPQTATLELRAEVKPVFRFSVRSAKGGERLDLGCLTKNGAPTPAVLEFQVESNGGQPYRIFQELQSPLTAETGVPLGDDAVAFSLQGASSGKTASSGRLAPGSFLLYESDGGSGDAFRAAYQAEAPPSASAGRYSGLLVFRVESAAPDAAGQRIQVPVVFEIESIFNLDIDIPGGFGLQFGKLKAGEEAPERQVLLKVQSNLRQPYQVSQVLTRRMTTADGHALGDDAFRYAVQKTSTGTVEALALRPVPAGESLLFLSDGGGTPENLVCTYVLTIPPEARPGPYGTEIKYSITTL